jgi:putative MATE family efflux protein
LQQFLIEKFMSKKQLHTKLNLVEGSVVRHLIKMTIPMIWGILAVKLFNLVDAYFVAKLGTKELAALSFTFPVVLVFGNLTIGLGIGTSSVVARAIGGGNTSEVKRLITDSLILSCIIVGLATVVGVLTIEPVFRILGATEEIIPLVSEYMTIWYVGIFCLVIPMVGNSALRATGDTFFPAVQMCLAALLNCILDPLLIFGFWNVEGLGIRGAAVATVFSRALALIGSIWALGFRDRLLSIDGLTFSRLIDSWKQVLRISFPASLTNMIVPVTGGIITALLAKYGQETVAGFGVASRIEGFAVVCFLALSSTIGPIVGQNWGARKKERSWHAIKAALFFCLGFGAVVAILLMTLGENLLGLFSSEPGVTSVAYYYILVVSLSYGFQGTIYVINASFNSLGLAIRSTAISGLRMFVLYIPFALLGEHLFGWKGIFIAAAFANIGASLCGFLWLKRGFRGLASE